MKKAPTASVGEAVKARPKQFSVMNKLKKRALKVVAENLSKEEEAGMKEAFDMMDSGKKGKINVEELRAGLHKLGHQISDVDVHVLMEAVRISSSICYGVSSINVDVQIFVF